MYSSLKKLKSMNLEKKSETNLTNCQNCSVCVEVFLQSYYVLVRLLKKTTSKKVKSWKEVKCCDKDWTRFNARVHLTIEQEFFLSFLLCLWSFNVLLGKLQTIFLVSGASYKAWIVLHSGLDTKEALLEALYEAPKTRLKTCGGVTTACKLQCVVECWYVHVEPMLIFVCLFQLPDESNPYLQSSPRYCRVVQKPSFLSNW